MKKQFSLNKLIMVSVAALLTTAAYSANEKKVCDKAQDKGPMAYSYPKDMGLTDPRDFYSFGDFLIMQAKEDGLEFSMNDTTGDEAFPVDAGEINGFSTGSHKWNWNVGARGGFGFYFDYDDWNFEAKWTWIHFKDDKSSPNQGSAGIQQVPMWLQPVAIAQLVYTSQRWKGNYNTFDLSLGKPFHASRYFILNPYVAVRGAWINQHLTARYSGIMDGATRIYKTVVRGDNEYWGVGGVGGFEAEWLLGANCYLFSNAKGSLMFSKFDVDQTSDLVTNDYDVHHEFYTTTPNFEIAVGGSWGTYMSHKKYFFSIKGAYEFIYWADMNQYRRFYNSTAAVSSPAANAVANGALSFSGLSFRLAMDF